MKRKFLIVLIAMIAVKGRSVGEDQALSHAGERLKTVLSKIAPLEHWEFSWSDSGPRICWRFFRPEPRMDSRVVKAINNFRGQRRWSYYDDCLRPWHGETFMAPFGMTSGQPSAVPQSPVQAPTKEEASKDLQNLADYLESQLHLADASPKPFSEALLTKDGLRQSHGPFEDFEDGGERTVFLITHPTDHPRYDPTKRDIFLSFAPFDDEQTAILADILGIEISSLENRALTDEEKMRIQKAFPVLWSISDYYEDAYLSPADAAALYRECEILDKSASTLASVRGLDKLLRIAYWASTKKYGVLFSAP